ncbi:hypothetical protein L202_04965 [Cryptococcus amylolentus CBS 6039]|uniref:PinX1-related protein 1 n=1 Tax=Cryptococcus amylolentus CBS 6039 TaxID=1295533 RepID=A0A1E3HNC5_9TREE|nr:hypothetical protein L202_04965 [Cryptococcus amylolentus CBS 6039]ODN77850.1 hypothetical protein L202_04965 [Cryptococcus amylolentus CBS 6039]
MGLSERKVKQRIGLDPRNLNWSENKDRFSYKHMKALGWEDNTGLGSSMVGNANNIAVARKDDNGGIGMARARKEGGDMAAGAGQAGAGLEDVLRRLAGGASPSPAPTSPKVEEERPKVIRNKMASRQRHLIAKKAASQSPQALAEILGIPVSALPASALASPSTSASSTTKPEPEVKVELDDGKTDEMVTTSTLSVSDYFRQKMREKMAARQAASGASAPAELPVHSLESLASLPGPKAVGGTAWEGQKMQFEEVKEEFNPSEATAEIPREDAEKERKRQRKEEKRLEKLRKEAVERDDAAGIKAKKVKQEVKEEVVVKQELENDPLHQAHEQLEKFEHAGEDVKPVIKEDREEKRKRKEEKRREKEEKRREKEGKKRKREDGEEKKSKKGRE